ncbi:Tetratricopeptide repeat protein [Candidatus Magnetomoraceae bacterium gMMP-1]
MQKNLHFIVIITLVFLIMPSYAQDNMGETYYDLSIFAYEEGDYESAEKNGLKAIELAPDNPFYSYQLGIIYLKSKHYQKAADYFLRTSEKSPDLKISSYYYAALCYLNMGKTEKSLEKLEYVKDHTDSEEIRSLAVKLIQSFKNKKKALKPYQILLKIDYQYNNNVRLDPLNQDVYADEDDFIKTGFFSGQYNIINKEKYKLGAKYNHYQTWHNNLNEYDFTASMLNIYTEYTLFPVTFTFSFLPSFYWVDSDKYLKRQEFKSGIRWKINDKFLTRLSYSYHKDNYLQNDDRDGYANNIDMEVYSIIGKNKGYLFSGLGVEEKSASHPDQDYGQLKAKLGISLSNILWNTDLRLTGKYFNKKYDHIDSVHLLKRKDEKYYGCISLSHRIFYEWLRTSCEFNYTRNNSNIDAYEYEKKVMALSMAVNF